MKRFINLTPHEINIVGENPINIPASGAIARCQEISEDVGTIAGVPIIRKSFGAVENLPAPQDGIVYIVSLLVAQATRRDDVLSPSNIVRDPDGRIIGCKSFCRV